MGCDVTTDVFMARQRGKLQKNTDMALARLGVRQSAGFD